MEHYDGRVTRVFYFDLGWEFGPTTNRLKKISLNYVVDMLVVLDISPNDIVMALNANGTFDAT